MSLVTLQHVHFDFGREPILVDAGLTLVAGDRAALVGPNGAGKSTLLRLLAGELPPQRGERQVSGGVRIHLLPQQTEALAAGDPAAPVFDTVARLALGDVLAMERELNALAERLAAASGPPDPALVARQGELQQRFEQRDGYRWRATLSATLAGLGVPEARWQAPVSDLSGGERRRAALAAALLSDCHLLLLDEPTNHLDLAGREWLEAALQRDRRALVMVSHDRYFLDRVATRILALRRGRLTAFRGNYTAWLRESERAREREEAAWRRQQERVARTEEFIRRNLAGQKTKQAQSRRRLLEREERLERPDAPARTVPITLAPARPSGETVLEVRGLGKRFGDRWPWRDLSFRLQRGERLGVVGPNGCGKSTLLRVLAGELSPDAGSFRWGHHVDVGFYDQHLHTVRDERTVLEEIAAVWPDGTVREWRGFAAAFGFTADMVDRPVGRLSGGERARLALMRLIREGHNTLLLDEPTNHLDMATREALEEALAGFTGTLVVVSHDRRLLDRTVTRLLVFPAVRPGTDPVPPVFHAGNWTDWTRRRAAAAADDRPEKPRRPAPEEPRRAAPRSGLSKNEIARRRRWIAAAEERIAALEAERDTLLAELASPDTAPERRAAAGRRVADVEREIAEQMEQWERWHDEIDG